MKKEYSTWCYASLVKYPESQVPSAKDLGEQRVLLRWGSEWVGGFPKGQQLANLQHKDPLPNSPWSFFRSPSLYTIFSPKCSLTMAFKQWVTYRQAPKEGPAAGEFECVTGRNHKRLALTWDGLWFRGAGRRGRRRQGAALLFSTGRTSRWSHSLGVMILSTNAKFHCCLCCFQKANKLAGCWCGRETQFKSRLVDLYQ